MNEYAIKVMLGSELLFTVVPPKDTEDSLRETYDGLCADWLSAKAYKDTRLVAVRQMVVEESLLVTDDDVIADSSVRAAEGIFELGNVTVQPRAFMVMTYCAETEEHLLERFTRGIWGALSVDQICANFDNIKANTGKVVARYPFSRGYVIGVTTDLEKGETLISNESPETAGN